MSKEDLLDAEQSTSAVIAPVAVEETAVAVAITVAVAGLLSEDTGDLLGDFVSASHEWIRETVRRERHGKWFRGFGGRMIWRYGRDRRARDFPLRPARGRPRSGGWGDEGIDKNCAGDPGQEQGQSASALYRGRPASFLFPHWSEPFSA